MSNTVMIASREPQYMGYFKLDCHELVYHVYMPVKMDDMFGIRIPKHLNCYWPLIKAVVEQTNVHDKYVYLTVKRTYLEAGDDANRPGWHIDGYGSNDLNFIWSDNVPTEFCEGAFELSADHAESLVQMKQQVDLGVVKTYFNNALLRLDNTIVHRVGVCKQDCIRTFVKISVSSQRYNLIGNAHNHLFDYEWDMVARQPTRNCPIAKNA